MSNHRSGRRSVRSTLTAALTLGACSTLLATGLVFISASPASAATATKLSFTTQPPTVAVAGATLATFKVLIEDGTNAPATTDLTDSITISSSCTLGGTAVESAIDGIATFSALAIDTGTSCTLTATDTSTPLTTATSTSVAVSPSTAAKLVFTTEPTTTANEGASLATFRVSVEDTYGNVITTGTGATDAVTISSSCTLGGTATATAAAGVATFSALVINSTGACTLTATDTSRTLTTATSASVAVSVGAAAKLAFTTVPPTTATPGASLATFRVSVEDTYGNVITTGTGATDAVTITSSCTLGGTATATAVAGVATFSALAIDNAGACTLTATDTSRTLTTATSASVAVSVGAAAKLAFTTEPPTTANEEASLATFRVSVEDTYGNVIPTGTGATDSIAISSSCTLGGTATATAVAGVATFSALAIDNAGACTLTAKDTSRTLTTATSTSVAVSVGAAAKLAFTTEPPTAAAPGTSLATFRVSVEDTYGNVITTGTGATDSIAISSSCTLGGTATATAVAGVATFSALAIDNAGACTLTATDTSRTLTTATSTSVAVSVGVAAKLAFTTEVPTTAAAGASLATFRVSVEDTYGNVIPTGTGATDNVTITSSCTLGGTATATAVAGVATFSALAIDNAGACTLTATDTSRNLTTATSTSVTVSASAPATLAFTTEPPATANEGTALATLKVSVEDAYGNVIPTGTGGTDNVTITSSCTLGGTAMATAVAGVATFSALEISSTGSCTLTATDTSRNLTTATSSATDSQGTQAVLNITSLSGTLGIALTLLTSGGSGTGAVTFIVTNGTAAGCAVSGSSLTVTSIGTCVVTATKAASITNLAISSSATTVRFVIPGPVATHVIGAVWVGRTTTVKIAGSYFYGRPRVISNVAGVTAIVIGDSGQLLTVKVTVKVGVKTGVHSFTIILANGKRTSVKYNLR